MTSTKVRTLAQIITAMSAFTLTDPSKSSKPADFAFVWLDYVDGRLRLRAMNGSHLAEFVSEHYRDGRHRVALAEHEVALAPGGYLGTDLARRLSLMKHDMIAPTQLEPTSDHARILKSSRADCDIKGPGARSVYFDAALVATAMTATTKLFRDKMVPTAMFVPIDNLTPLRFVAKDAWGGLVVVLMQVRA